MNTDEGKLFLIGVEPQFYQWSFRGGPWLHHGPNPESSSSACIDKSWIPGCRAKSPRDPRNDELFYVDPANHTLRFDARREAFLTRIRA
ncbi:MAG: hypothetical protein ACREPJ_11220, partial [Rhodanobacteraceae bacterium]